MQGELPLKKCDMVILAKLSILNNSQNRIINVTCHFKVIFEGVRLFSVLLC